MSQTLWKKFRLLFVPLLSLTATCAPLQPGSELISACQFYITVASITGGLPGAAPITQALDPVCRLILAGQPAPSGIDAALIRARTVELEQLGAHARGGLH